MVDFPQLRIIHVSDLHFGRKHLSNPSDPTGATAGIPTLADLIQNDLNGEYWKDFSWALTSQRYPIPLLIAATGDFTEVAEPTEFDQAYRFVSELVQKPVLGAQLPLQNVFVVPGNHDVDFTRREPEHRFTAYCNFYNKLFKDCRPFVRPDQAGSLSRIHRFPADRFLIAEINSCFYVEKETVDESRGQVDLDTIASLRRELEQISSEAKEWIKITLVHHHPVLLPSFIERGRGVDAILNATSLLELLRKHGFQLVLHGHKHFPQVFSYDPDPAWLGSETRTPMLIVAGGSAGSNELPRAIQSSNTYNLITIKWNPKALQTRIQVVTRGLTRMDATGDLDPDQWRWHTLRVFDKILTPFRNFPEPGVFERITPPESEDSIEAERNAVYEKLGFNMPVVEVLPSLEPGQGYEARAWIVRHRHHEVSPKRVIWSAGPRFDRKVCGPASAPDFCVYFHYWGPMLVQAQLIFDDRDPVTAYVYARLPDSITRQ